MRNAKHIVFMKLNVDYRIIYAGCMIVSLKLYYTVLDKTYPLYMESCINEINKVF